jgi:hypothetical protein
MSGHASLLAIATRSSRLTYLPRQSPPRSGALRLRRRCRRSRAREANGNEIRRKRAAPEDLTVASTEEGCSARPSAKATGVPCGLTKTVPGLHSCAMRLASRGVLVGSLLTIGLLAACGSSSQPPGASDGGSRDSSASSGGSSGSSSGTSSCTGGSCNACCVDQDCQSCPISTQPGYLKCCVSSTCISWSTTCPLSSSGGSGSSSGGRDGGGHG